MNPLIQLKKTTPAILVVLACFGLSPMTQALLPPPLPDGGYPNGNTAEGDFALFNLTSGTGNTAIGFDALYSTTTGVNNTANGYQALASNNGNNNTANGSSALVDNAMGNNNTAIGHQALEGNTMGGRNTAVGVNTLEENTTGSANTAIGYNALYHSGGSNNIALGANAGIYATTGSNNIDIGNLGLQSDAGKIRIGTQGMHTGTFIAGIYNIAVTGSPVMVNANGKLGVTTSSARFKDEIKPMDTASEAILALKPVTFRYKKEIDPAGVSQFGLIAEEVAKVNPALVLPDKEGKPNTVRYEAVNAMLLNEFLKEHRTVQNQQKEIDALKAELKEQKALIQKVNARLEMSKAAPQVAENN
jgi:hypothetical protein